MSPAAPGRDSFTLGGTLIALGETAELRLKVAESYTAEPGTGLVPDRWPKPPFSSIAAIGFALNAYAIGAERRYVTRAAARARVLLTLKFLYGLIQ